MKETLPTTSKTLERYGCEIKQPNTSVHISNEWANRKADTIKKHENDLIKFREIEKGDITSSTFPSDPKLNLKTQKWGDLHNEWSRFVVDLEDDDNWAGRFWLSHNHNEPNTWIFDHRDIHPKYQGNSLGNSVSELIDSSVQAVADDTGEIQKITCDVEQVDVLLWFLKNDYLPANQESEQLINMLLSDEGPENFEISSKPGGGMNYYIFKKGYVDWQDIENIHELRETSRTIQIKLEKEFSPKTNPLISSLRKALRKVISKIVS